MKVKWIADEGYELASIEVDTLEDACEVIKDWASQGTIQVGDKIELEE